MPQAQTGHRTRGSSPAYLKSTPKLTRINGDDNLKIIYRNLGNNHAYPFIWADEFTVASGTSEVTIASGIKFHGYTLADYGNITASPMADTGAVRWYIDKDTTNNIVKIKTTANVPDTGVTFDVKFMLGEDSNIEDLACRGTGSPMPSLP